MHGYRSALATPKGHPVAAALAALALVAVTPAALAIYSQVTAFESFQEGAGPLQVVQNAIIEDPNGGLVHYNYLPLPAGANAVAYADAGALRMGAGALAAVFDARASLALGPGFTPPPGGLPVVPGTVESQHDTVSVGSQIQNEVHVVGSSPSGQARIRFTASLDGLIRHEAPDARENIQDASFEGGYRIFDEQAYQQAVNNCIFAPETCLVDAENAATLVQFGARGFTLEQAILTHSPGGVEGTNHRKEYDWSWELSSQGQLVTSGGDNNLVEFDCFPNGTCLQIGAPLVDTFQFDTGTVSFEFLVNVGARLTIDGSLGVSASVKGSPGSDAGWVQNQFLNTLGASLVSLTPGVTLQFAAAPALGPAPGGSVPAPSTPWLLAWALLPATGWRRRRSRVPAGSG